MSQQTSETKPIGGSPATARSYGILNQEELGISADHGIPVQYDVNHLLTFNVFTFLKGTVFQSRLLWQETILTGMIYWFVFTWSYMFRYKGFSEDVGKESTIRAFMAMFSTLIGLLLSFYTSLNLGRWWQMRVAVQSIMEGSKKLTMMVAHGCLNDAQMLQAIHRYSRASVHLIFAASQWEKGQDSPLQKTVEIGLLTQEEADYLKESNPHMTFVQAETIWAWIGNWVTRVHDQGFTKGAPHYCALMAAVEEGRNGVATIQAFLETPVPLGYVHLLCLIVKLHNVLLSILMAFASVMLSGGQHGFNALGVFRTAFRAFLMPFLYNAILVLNSEVTDPFGGDEGDFDWGNYDVNLVMSARSYVMSARNDPTAKGKLPGVIAQWKGVKPETAA